MGRGRAKAKQTKVARELKYSSPNTDLASLQRELSGHESDTLRVEPRRAEVDGSRPPWDDDHDEWQR